MIPFVIFGSMWMALPFSSFGGPMSKACKTVAMLMKSDASAKCFPGQILKVRSLRLRICAPVGDSPSPVAKHESRWILHTFIELTIGV